MPSAVHGFREKLAWSEAQRDEPFWDAVYRKAFPNIVNHMPAPGDVASQRMGIDRVVLLANGKTLYIDEKKRGKEYGDILLEYVSVDRTGAPGWIEKDMSIDFLAYAFIPTGRCYLFSWPLLRRAWELNGDGWKERYSPPIRARNRDYDTLSVAVPIPVLQRAIARSLVIDIAPHERQAAESRVTAEENDYISAALSKEDPAGDGDPDELVYYDGYEDDEE
jgi:hypothetical protein